MTTITYSDGRPPITFDCETVNREQTENSVGDILNLIPPFVLFQVELKEQIGYSRKDMLEVLETSKRKKGVKTLIQSLLDRNKSKKIYCTWQKISNIKEVLDEDYKTLDFGQIRAIVFNKVRYVVN